ncbi:putative 16S rRNA (Cytidine(1402)-2'-O)-methyltransferase [Heracleum sosnowskyi]|uniref:16S rRNA (Cytidine(1402)-2'-O)-methyltransferase n=1 Tax=Heracleum sosnowskyi TaxID=360622 RepID=A0AAD8IU73_9APIA|nr:putative 16S rRNA (Cytidine(1402)-2'-O)-methyltransferase [Heracleum sosnowskyi]
MAASVVAMSSKALLRSCFSPQNFIFFTHKLTLNPTHFHMNTLSFFCSLSQNPKEQTHLSLQEQHSSTKKGILKPGLYLVGTPIGNLEDITLRALRVLKSADVILSEDTRHSGKLLQHYDIKTPLLSYHKFNEFQREQAVLKRLQEGEIVALISDAGTPGISDPGMDLAKLCVDKNILVTPIPGPSALVAAVSASGLPTNEFTFVGFLPKHAGTRKERLSVSANEATTQIFFVPPHKLSEFLEETSSVFGDSRRCVMARELTKIHEQFWRGTLGDAKVVFSTRTPKGEITFLIEGKAICVAETPSESQLENELGELISNGHSLSEAVKVVAAGTSTRRKTIYTLALRKFGKQVEAEDDTL